MYAAEAVATDAGRLLLWWVWMLRFFLCKIYTVQLKKSQVTELCSPQVYFHDTNVSCGIETVSEDVDTGGVAWTEVA